MKIKGNFVIYIFKVYFTFMNPCIGSPKFNLAHSATFSPTKPCDKPNNYTNACRKHNFSTKKNVKISKKKKTITDALLVSRQHARYF